MMPWPKEPRYFDRDGNPLELLEWGRLFEDWEYRGVKDETFTRNDGKQQRVSTVWLGEDFDAEIWYMNEPPPPDFKPRIFGTMVWEPEGKEFRWATLAEAIKGHDLIVTSLMTGDMETFNRLHEQHGN